MNTFIYRKTLCLKKTCAFKSRKASRIRQSITESQKDSKKQYPDLCCSFSSLCWSVVCWRWRTASCRPLILAFFSFSTMTKREYSSLSSISLSRTCRCNLVRKTHRHQCRCKNIHANKILYKLYIKFFYACTHVHSYRQIHVLKAEELFVCLPSESN